jgi:cellulose synthase/poly-beta-1,6-N-acetylglucosamine synthase-like glycosyltransferase
MQLVLQLIFWACVGLMLHSYVLYPWIIGWMAKGKTNTYKQYLPTDELPCIYILMSAYNEQRVIADKIESVFDTSYPIDKIQFYIGSDNSSDATNEIIATYADQIPQIKFHPYYERNGKSGVINKLHTIIQSQPHATVSDVYVLTDANVFFTPSTLFELAKYFTDPSIGQAAATILNKGQREDGISIQETAYIQRENLAKYQEGILWGTMQGAFGACYAMRADCFRAIPPNFMMEDFYISMDVMTQGKKAIVAPEAICYEDVSNEVGEEFKRKTRISTGNFQNLGVYWKLLFRFNALSFCFFSHKVIRWIGGFLILIMLLSLSLLAFHSLFYLLLLAGLLLLLVSPVIDNFFKRMGIHLSILRFASYFTLMNAALIYGWYKYTQGIKSSTWTPTKRNI